jgi:type IV secretory pathway VirB2 component (pilin)
MIFVFIPQGSLSDAPPVSAISTAANWVSNLLFGPLATAIAVVAIASIGLALMSGRIDLRRGLSVLIGCFLLFGARGLTDGLRSAAMDNEKSVVSTAPPPPTFSNPKPSSSNTNAFDPYAGAAVRTEQ